MTTTTPDPQDQPPVEGSAPPPAPESPETSERQGILSKRPRSSSGPTRAEV